MPDKKRKKRRSKKTQTLNAVEQWLYEQRCIAVDWEGERPDEFPGPMMKD